MLKVTIIAPSGQVGVDGDFRAVDLSGLDPDIHAVQRDGAAGEIEYKRGSGKGNEAFNDFTPFDVFQSRWVAAAPPPPPPPPSPEDQIDGFLQSSGMIGLLGELAAFMGITPEQLIANIKTRAGV